MNESNDIDRLQSSGMGKAHAVLHCAAPLIDTLNDSLRQLVGVSASLVGSSRLVGSWRAWDVHCRPECSSHRMAVDEQGLSWPSGPGEIGKRNLKPNLPGVNYIKSCHLFDDDDYL